MTNNQSAGPDPATLHAWHERFRHELLESVIPFWMRHSLDRKNGGFFNCLDRDGKVYDTTKHVWLQGRQVWMLSKLHNNAPTGTEGQRSSWLDAAKSGADFLQRFARRPDKRCYFALTAEGKPLQLQRKIFSECFYVMAMAEHARATGNAALRQEARDIFAEILKWSKDLTLVGRPAMEGAVPASSLAIPMILLNLIDELHDVGETTYAGVEEWCVQQIDKHYRPELRLVLETVGTGGELLDSPEGRLVNPGHAIEAGWFLLAYARKKGNAVLADKALNMIEWSLDFGWDTEHGGIFYFLDRGGYSPIQLEWSMKLWWPHCEALVALLMAWRHTGEAKWWRKFEQMADYTFAKFPDAQYGEWFGYLDQRGEVSMRFKGGPYKGCFHVPRAMFLCMGLTQA